MKWVELENQRQYQQYLTELQGKYTKAESAGEDGSLYGAFHYLTQLAVEKAPGLESKMGWSISKIDINHKEEYRSKKYRCTSDAMSHICLAISKEIVGDTSLVQQNKISIYGARGNWGIRINSDILALPEMQEKVQQHMQAVQGQEQQGYTR